jgi:hypothetical protein
MIKALSAIVFLVFSMLLLSCDYHNSNRHMMTGGMMNGDMMKQMTSGNGLQSLPEAQSEDARLFRHYCTQCHAPPSPPDHTSKEWPSVVARMRQYMVAQGKEVPDRLQQDKIISYLQRYAN